MATDKTEEKMPGITYWKEGLALLIKQGPMVTLLVILSVLFWNKNEANNQALIDKYKADNLSLKQELATEREQSKKDREEFRLFMRDCMNKK